MRERVVFVAGATGAVGRTVVSLAGERDVKVVPHARPKSAGKAPVAPAPAIFELSDRGALEAALKGCTTVMQLIGTMRKRFASGDTYETSDIGTTEDLVRAAVRAGIEHFILLSSVGAGEPRGAYLKAKARAEQLVRDSGLPFTILRPSFFVGEGHAAPPVLGAVTRALGLKKYQPIQVEQLAATLLLIAREAKPLGVALEGPALWEVVGRV